MANSRIVSQRKKVKPDEIDGALRELDVIFGDLKALIAKVYASGGTDAASRIVSLASHAGYGERALQKESRGELKRAPRGSSRQFVEKVLAQGPKTIREIREAATTDVEKFLSYQTVRLELERGKIDKRYKKNKDKWSLS